MPPYKTPRSLESLSCDLVLGLLYHLTIRWDKFHQIWSNMRIGNKKSKVCLTEDCFKCDTMHCNDAEVILTQTNFCE